MNVIRIPPRELDERRSAMDESVTNLLTTASTAPAALMVSGEAGIGKSTMWLTGVHRAEADGFTVLSTRAAVSESGLAHAALADLLGHVDPAFWSDLPLPQRDSLDLVLLRDDRRGEEPDRRTTATAMSTVVHRLAESSPVLLAIDDLQWLDPASASILAFVTRRLTGPVGVLTTIRTGACTRATTALDLPVISETRRITLGPLTLGSLHSMLSQRLGRSLPRPALVRIYDISGGNPLYALELALAMNDPVTSGHTTLPGTLVDVVRTRVDPLGAEVQLALLAAAALTAPTVESVAHALGAGAAEVIGLLESAEDAGIVRIDGERLHFVHPLLKRGIYSGASSASRRRLHRRLADGTKDLELQARHLALGSATASPRIVRLLDSAAEAATRRGAPAAAAELLELATGLGGDTPARRVRTASCHLAAGDVHRARALVERSLPTASPGSQRMHALGVLARVHLFDDSVTAAGELLQQGLAESDGVSTARVQMMLGHAFTQLCCGAISSAINSTRLAAADATELRESSLLGQSLGLQLVLAMLDGDGFDETSLLRTPARDVDEADTPLPLQPMMNGVLAQAWSGSLDGARSDLAAVARSCRDRGDEYEQLYVGFHGAMIEVGRGDLDAAADLATDVTVRAEQLGGDVPLAMAATARATIDAVTGRVPEARLGGHAALDAARRCGADTLARSALTALAFLESSLGHHAAVVALVEPLLDADAARPRSTEIITAAYLPDVIDAFVNLGRFDEADLLIDRLERNGQRLDRPWMLAVGGRCRAALNAARGKLDAAGEAIDLAMVHHDRLPMPFERARSQLVLGQLQRRNRRKREASGTLSAALATFEALGATLWADRARTELARVDSPLRGGVGLTSSERAVAELAAAGMTNRDVAASLFISPKTVEAHLVRVYRKLHIRSRAELGSHMAHTASRLR